MPVATSIKPITGMMKKSLVVDLSTAFGLATAAGYYYWYGHHIPKIRHRDQVYLKIEEERAAAMGKPSDS